MKAFFTSLFTLILSCLTQAFDVRVNSFEDLPDSSPGDGIFSTGRTLPDGTPECTLRAAVMEVNALRVWPDAVATIIIPSGTYILTRQEVTSAEEDGRQLTTEWDSARASATGDLDLGHTGGGSIVLRGEGPSYPIIDANGIDRGIDISHSFKLFNTNEYRLENLVVRNGVTAEGGAGVKINNAPGRVYIRNCEIRNNRVGPDGRGGGIWNARGFLVLVAGCLIENNEAGGGGGIFQSYEGRGLEVYECTIRNNRAISSDAGGIGAESPYGVAPVGICSSLIHGNTSVRHGGGVGGAGAVMRITNSTISGNRARAQGGGVFCGNGPNATGFIACNSVTIVQNEALFSGGGIFTPSPQAAQFYNSIVAYNGQNANGMVTSVGYNLEDADTCGFSQPTDLVNTDPALAPLADNGGPTLTHAITPGSPASNSGPPNSSGIDWPLLAEPRPPAWPMDQRGVLRPRAPANADRGAYEFTLPNLIVDVPIESYPLLDSIYSFVVPFTLSGDASSSVIGVTPGKGVDNLRYELSSDHRSVIVRAELSRALAVPKDRKSNQPPLFSIQVQRPAEKPAFLKHGEAEFEGKVTVKRRLHVHPVLPLRTGNHRKSLQLSPGFTEGIPLLIEP